MNSILEFQNVCFLALTTGHQHHTTLSRIYCNI